MLDNVRVTLETIGCNRGVTISDVMGHGTQKGVDQEWHGEKFHLDILPKIMMDMVVKDDEVPNHQESHHRECGQGRVWRRQDFCV